MINGCSSISTPPAHFWGGIGMRYENGSENREGTTIGFEKSMGNGFGVGGEVSAVSKR